MSADITLVCSTCEAFGRVAVESMSVGTPVVGSNSGGLPEIIEDEVNGLLYKPGNPQMLANQVTRLVNDPELYELISQNCISSVYKRFTTDRYVADIESIIREVVSQQK
jgi:glycosyltransferase involved in cell wall biosynthesis